MSASATYDFASPDFHPPPTALVERDLAYASALIEAAERMQLAADLATLLPIIAAEAATIIAADRTAVICYAGLRREVTGICVERLIDDESVAQSIAAMAEAGLLITPGTIDDLRLSPGWVDRAPDLTRTWRSAMVLPMADPDPQNQIRIVWLSSAPGQFRGRESVAGLLARQASLALLTTSR